MAAVNDYAINVSDASGTGAGPYTATVFKNPSTPASGPTAGSDHTGPLGASGTAAATQINGAGSTAGFTNLGDALARAGVLILDDKAINNV